MNSKCKYASKVKEIDSAINLNYLLADAFQNRYEVSLSFGHLNKNIEWSKKTQPLSYSYQLTLTLLSNYLLKHSNKIIKLNISSTNIMMPFNRNIIIYVPYDIDIQKIKNEYSSIIV